MAAAFWCLEQIEGRLADSRGANVQQASSSARRASRSEARLNEGHRDVAVSGAASWYMLSW